MVTRQKAIAPKDVVCKGQVRQRINRGCRANRCDFLHWLSNAARNAQWSTEKEEDAPSEAGIGGVGEREHLA